MPKNNIILFLTDQWRWDTLNDSDCPAQLPSLHAFRKEAVNFVNAFTPVPLCTPARGTLFTGRLPHQNGTMDNVQGKSFYPHGKLSPDQTTYLEDLAEGGYHVAYVGKWHLGDGTLRERGIEDIALSDGGDTPLTAMTEVTFEAGGKSPFYATIKDGEPLDGVRVKQAIEMLPRLADLKQPFCLVVSLHAPHFPHHVPKRFASLYDNLPTGYTPRNWCAPFQEPGKPVAQSRPWHRVHDTSDLSPEDWRRTAQHYWGFCSYADDLFGQFRRAVHDAGLDPNTVLAFTSDHGEMLGAHGWFDKGPFFYDEVMRIPMLIKVPEQSGEEIRKNFVGLKDLFPTLLERAGAGGEVERSFFRSNNDTAYFVYDAYQGRQFRFRGLRNAHFKYSWSPHDLEELYDLEQDPGERHNLSNHLAYRQLKSQLKARLFEWMEQEGDYLSGPGHHPKVGSYVDGRSVDDQHDHSR